MEHFLEGIAQIVSKWLGPYIKTFSYKTLSIGTIFLKDNPHVSFSCPFKKTLKVLHFPMPLLEDIMIVVNSKRPP